MREHALAKTPALIVVGKKEGGRPSISIRRLSTDKQTATTLDAALRLAQALADGTVVLFVLCLRAHRCVSGPSYH